MNNQESACEQFVVLAITICEIWSNTRNVSDKEITHYLNLKIIELIKSIPDQATYQAIIETELKNEAIEEMEYLIEFLETNCRHNNYGAFKNV